jgi:hypothetical protein
MSRPSGREPSWSAGAALQVAVDRGSCDGELVGDLLDGVGSSPVFAKLVVHRLRDLGLAGGELGFLAAGASACAGGGEAVAAREEQRNEIRR